jgi:hypothetical protein
MGADSSADCDVDGAGSNGDARGVRGGLANPSPISAPTTTSENSISTTLVLGGRRESLTAT